MLYGRTSHNPISRFVTEIPTSLIYRDAPPVRRIDGYPPYNSYRQSHISETRTYYTEAQTTRSTTTFGGVGDKTTIGKTFTAPVKKAPATVFSEGDRVSHITFGEGEILSVKPMGSDVLYEISFDRVGTKKLMATYAKLKKIN